MKLKYIAVVAGAMLLAGSATSQSVGNAKRSAENIASPAEKNTVQTAEKVTVESPLLNGSTSTAILVSPLPATRVWGSATGPTTIQY